MGCNNDYCDLDNEDLFEVEPARETRLATLPEEYRIITARISRPELLAQLAEESAELCQAALKLRRALTGESPTPRSEVEAECALREEIADVLICLEAAGDYIRGVEVPPYIEAIRIYKLKRWAQRLQRTGK